jgi:hypothetical protein
LQFLWLNGIFGKHSEYLIDEPCIIVGQKGAAGEVHLSLKPSWAINKHILLKSPNVLSGIQCRLFSQYKKSQNKKRGELINSPLFLFWINLST